MEKIFVPHENQNFIPDSAAEAFSSAISMHGGVFSLYGYVGSQVVAGINYAFICKSSIDMDGSLFFIILYRNLMGKSRITKIKKMILPSTDDINIPRITSFFQCGGWHINTACIDPIEPSLSYGFSKAAESVGSLKPFPFFLGYNKNKEPVFLCTFEDNYRSLCYLIISNDGGSFLSDASSLFLAD